MVMLRKAACVALCAVLIVVHFSGCKRSSSSSIIGGETGPQEPSDRFIPHNPGTVSPVLGGVQGGDEVAVILPLDFDWAPGASEVFFLPDFSGNPAGKAKNVQIDLKDPWFLTCTAPPSSTGTSQVVNIVVTSGKKGTGGWPPPGSAVLKNAYTYIDPVQSLDFVARRAYAFGTLADPEATDYDGDGWTDIVGLAPEKNALVFVKNDGQGAFVRPWIRPLESLHPKHPDYTGLVAGNVDGDALDDIVVFGQYGFLLLLNDPGQPGTYIPKLSNDFRRGISGTLADLNGDGFGDLILGGIDAVRIFGFIPQINMFASYPIQLDTTLSVLDVAAADIDNDTDLDILSATQDQLIWYRTEGIGIFGPAQTLMIKAVSGKFGIRRIIAEDLNQDSNQDVIYTAADWNASSAPFPEGVVGVALADGSGGFATPVEYPVTGIGFGLTGAMDVRAIDADQDGNPDILAAAAGRNAVILFSGDGAGGLSLMDYYGVGMNPRYLAALDLEKDGFMDLLASEPEAGTFSFLEGIPAGGGDGGMAVNRFRCGLDLTLDIEPDAVQASDVNDDGLVDLVVMQSREGGIAVLLNDGGGFTPHAELTVPGNLLEGFCLFQANGRKDRYPDLAVAASNDGSPGVLAVLLNDGTGLFMEKQVLETAPEPISVRAGDVNNDGDQDLVVVEAGPDQCTIFQGDGFGLFKHFAQRNPLTGARNLILWDLDNDFDLDAALPAPGRYLLYMLLTDEAAGILAIVPGKTGIKTRLSASVVAAADFNLDGFPDMAINSRNESRALLLQNDGFLNFIGGDVIPLSGPAGSLRSIDINFDNQPDLCAAVPSAGGLEVKLNKGGALINTDYSPLPANGSDSDEPPLWIDLDGDILPELLVPSRMEKKITILFNQSK